MIKFKFTFWFVLFLGYYPVFGQKNCDELEKKALSVGNPRESMQIWTKMLDMDCSNKTLIFNNRGMLYFETFEELDSALIEFDKGLALDSNDFHLLINKASLLSMMKKQEEAIPLLKKAINVKPNLIDAYIMLGVVYARNKNFEAALKSTNDALKIDSTSFEAINNLSRMHAALGDTEEELNDLTLLVARNPKLANAWSNKAYFYLKTRQYDSAIQYYTKAIELNPKDYRNYVNRGMCHGYEGDTDIELEDYTKAIDIAPNYLAFYNRGRYYLKHQEYEKAIKDNDKVIELAPDYAPAFLNKGNALFKMEKYQDAANCYTKGLSCESDRDTKSKLEYQLKNVKELLKK